MDDSEFKNWERIRDYFDTLPEYKRDNMFYRRAVAITAGSDDPLPPVEKLDK